MSNFVLTKTRFFEGVWEGIVTVGEGDGSDPAIEVLHLGKAVDGVLVRPDEDTPGRWNLSIDIPVVLLGDGVHVLDLLHNRLFLCEKALGGIIL